MSLLWCTRPQARVGHSPLSYKQRPDSYGLPMSDMDDGLVQYLPDPTHYQVHTTIGATQCIGWISAPTGPPSTNTLRDLHTIERIAWRKGRGSNLAVTVSLGKHMPSGQMVAIKRVDLEQFDWDTSLLQYEVLMHRLNDHPHLLPVLASFVHENEIWTVLPLMAYGSSHDLMQAHFHEGLPELAIAFILRDVLEALDYLHQRGVIHRGLRASHILISAAGHVCLTGLRDSFNMLRDGLRHGCVHDLPRHYVRSLLWASPEMLQQNLTGYGTMSDIYSFGVMACELANGVVPFSDMAPTQMLLEKLDGITPQLLDNTTVPELQQLSEQSQADSGFGTDGNGRLTPPYQRVFSEHFHNFVQCCLEMDPKERPSTATLLQHSFLRQVRRRSSIESLPELLQPVSPLTDIITSLPTVESGVGSLAQKMEAVDLGEDTEEWTF